MKLETRSLQDIQLHLASESLFERLRLFWVALISINVTVVVTFSIVYFISDPTYIFSTMVAFLSLISVIITWLATRHKFSHHAALSRDNNHLLSEPVIHRL